MLKTLLAASLLIAVTANAQKKESQEVINEKIEKVFNGARLNQDPKKRPVFGKAHGCVQAKFQIKKPLPSALNDYKDIGIFKRESYDAWIRFSNDGGLGPDTQLTNDGKLANPNRGMAIKLVLGAGPDGQPVTQDFLMQTHQVFFVDDAQDFSLLFGPKGEDLKRRKPIIQRILDDMDDNVLDNPLHGEYFTPVPISLGSKPIKFKAEPCRTPPSVDESKMKSENYLRENLAESVKNPRGACFTFSIQLQRSESSEPVDEATKKWAGRFEEVAEITIPGRQNINDETREKICEDLSFTAWHHLPGHEPLGTLNLARKHVYDRMSIERHKDAETIRSEPTVVFETSKTKSKSK